MGCGQSSKAAAAPSETTRRTKNQSTRRESTQESTSGDGHRNLLTSVVPPEEAAPRSSTQANEAMSALDIGLVGVVPRRNSGGAGGKNSKNASSNTMHSHTHKMFSITADDEFDAQQTQSAGQHAPFLESTGEWKEMRQRLEGDGYMSPLSQTSENAFETQLMAASHPAVRGAAADASQLSSISTMEGGNVSAQDGLFSVATPRSGSTSARGTPSRLPAVKHRHPNDNHWSDNGSTGADIASVTMTETPLQSNMATLDSTTNSSNAGELLSQAMTVIDSQLVVVTKSQFAAVVNSASSSALTSPKESVIGDFAYEDPT